MSLARQQRMMAGASRVAVLVASVVGAGALAPSVAAAAPASQARAALAPVARSAQAPSKVIDAQTDPTEAGQALDSGCANISNCKFTNDTPITVAYGPFKILGDKLYNCSPESDESAYAETATGITDEREETTSLSESVSIKVQGSILGLESASLEFKAFSSQAESFSTSVSTTSAVAVPPMWEGWTQYRVETASVTGSAYVSSGIQGLVEVTGIDLSFPGYTQGGDTPVEYVQVRQPMSEDDIKTYCDAIPSSTKLGASRGLRSGSFTITLCQAAPACASRQVSGVAPLPISKAAATLVRGGRTYATGTDTQGRIQLTVHGTLPAGRYTLNLKQPERISEHGHRHYAITYTLTVVPVTLGR